MKKILNIVLCFLLCLNITACSNSTNTTSIESSSQPENTEGSTENQQEDKISFKLSDGTFKVGKDLDPGIYVLVKHDGEFMGSFDITTDTTGDSYYKFSKDKNQ